MIGVSMYITIKTLWQKGISKSEISKLTNHDWKTVHKVIKNLEKGQEHPTKQPHPCRLDSHKEEILKWLEEDFTSVVIHRNITEQGINISYGAVRNYVSKLTKKGDVCIRFHTKPGEEAQVDFGYVGLIRNELGKKKKAWIFNMRLSYSRLDYYEIVYDQTVETFIQCHINAFQYFKGVPEYIKLDNLKAAILEANFYQPVYQELYKTFSNNYGFKPIPCRVRHPEEKGKVESGIKYVKNNFFLGRTFEDISEARKRLAYWLDNTCNVRIHGTTKKKPRELFEAEEASKLKSLPEAPFVIPQTGTRLVYRDCHVYVKYNYYSVPYEYVGKEVDVQISNGLLKIYYNYKEIAVHPILKGKGLFSTNESHYPKYKVYLSTQYQEGYQVKMLSIGNYANDFFYAVVNEYPHSWNRTISGIIDLTKTYTAEIINLSCRRALFYGALQYSTVKNICKEGCYNLPLDLQFYNEEEPKYEYAQM